MTETSNTNATRHKSRNGETHTPFFPMIEREDLIERFKKVSEEAKKSDCYVEKVTDGLEMGQIPDRTVTAYKETEGKLFYELDWSFITQMAERMASNKKDDKYELFNWKKPMTPKGVEDLKQATMRHLLEVMQGRYEDDGREFGHIEAISDNMMMLNYQLKSKND